MSGETERDPSAWTPDLLYAHFRARFDANAELYRERYEAQQRDLPPLTT